MAQDESWRARAHCASGLLRPTKLVEVENTCEVGRVNQRLVHVVRATLAIRNVIEHCFVRDAHVHAWRLPVISAITVVTTWQDRDGRALYFNCEFFVFHFLSFCFL